MKKIFALLIIVLLSYAAKSQSLGTLSVRIINYSASSSPTYKTSVEKQILYYEDSIINYLIAAGIDSASVNILIGDSLATLTLQRVLTNGNYASMPAFFTDGPFGSDTTEISFNGVKSSLLGIPNTFIGTLGVTPSVYLKDRWSSNALTLVTSLMSANVRDSFPGISGTIPVISQVANIIGDSLVNYVQFADSGTAYVTPYVALVTLMDSLHLVTLQYATNNGNTTTNNLIRRHVIGAVTYQDIVSDTGINLQKGIVPEYGLNYSPVLNYSFLTLHGGTNDAWVVPMSGDSFDRTDTVRKEGEIAVTSDSAIFATPYYVSTHSGSGTVTSVSLSLPSLFTVSGSPVTSSGTLTATLATQTANKVFAGATSGTTTPTFRSLVSADIPSLTGGQVGITGLSATGTASSTTYLRGDNTWATITSGGVTSVATDATLTGGPITTTGTLGINLAQANTWTGTITEQKNALTTTVVPSVILQNTTAGIAGTTIQNSPALQFSGGAFVTATAYTNTATAYLTSSIAGSAILNFDLKGAGSTTNTAFQVISNGATSYISANGLSFNSTNTYLSSAGLSYPNLIIYKSTASSGFNHNFQTASAITSTSGLQTFMILQPSYNEASGSASNYDLSINRTETAVGSGTQRLITTQVNNVEKFGVDNKGKINQVTGGTNSPTGTATLSSGTVTITNSLVTANSIIWVQYQSGQALSLGAGAISTLRVSAQTAGTSFVIVGDTTAGVTNITDNSPVQWWIVN